jgi:hypothetical protein
MDDGITEKGLRMKQIAQAGSEDIVGQEREARLRGIHSSYQVIRTVLSIVRPSLDLGSREAFEQIDKWRSYWSKGAHGDGQSGEILIKMSGLLDLDSREMLNPLMLVLDLDQRLIKLQN